MEYAYYLVFRLQARGYFLPLMGDKVLKHKTREEGLLAASEFFRLQVSGEGDLLIVAKTIDMLNPIVVGDVYVGNVNSLTVGKPIQILDTPIGNQPVVQVTDTIGLTPWFKSGTPIHPSCLLTTRQTEFVVKG